MDTPLGADGATARSSGLVGCTERTKRRAPRRWAASPLALLVTMLAVVACTDGDPAPDGAPVTSAESTEPAEPVSRTPEALWRPELRYSPPFGWMNDPNGLSLVDGRWHMFFQYNPDSVTFRSIGWGHAVSDDLAHWETWPVAIEPAPDWWAFSGSIVTNTGPPLCDPDPDPTCMVALFTANRFTPDGFLQTQDAAVSDDGGRTFSLFEGNPVLDLGQADFRDPKVFFHEDTQRWVMVAVLPKERQVVLFGSHDLVQWEELSRFGPVGAIDGVWECPDLFPLPVVGDTGADERRWVMKVDSNEGHPAGGSGGQYFVGDFDGTTFTADPDQPLPRWIDGGRDFYCATTFHGGADDGGRQLWTAWMNDWTYAAELPTFPFRGSMTVPRRLWLVPSGDGVELAQEPVLPEGSVLAQGDDMELPSGAALVEIRIPDEPEGRDDEVLVEFSSGDVVVAALEWQSDGSMELHRTDDGNDGPPSFPGTSVSTQPVEGDLLRIMVDRNGLEVFDESGTSVVTSLLLPVSPLDTVRVRAGDLKLDAQVTDLSP